MRWLALCLLAHPALACDDPVCRVAPDSLSFSRVITFDDLPSSFGIGRAISGIVDQKGARFGEAFAGQTLSDEDGFDRLSGAPRGPLALAAGDEGRNLGAIRLFGSVVLKGHGSKGFPNAQAVGEGSIAILFDRDQPALELYLFGAEGGSATLTFYDRAGRALHRITLSGIAEEPVAFLRQDKVPDIAGLTIENADPEGIGIDNLRFEFDELMGALGDRRRWG